MGNTVLPHRLVVSMTMMTLESVTQTLGIGMRAEAPRVCKTRSWTHNLWLGLGVGGCTAGPEEHGPELLLRDEYAHALQTG